MLVNSYNRLDLANYKIRSLDAYWFRILQVQQKIFSVRHSLFLIRSSSLDHSAKNSNCVIQFINGQTRDRVLLITSHN